MAHIGKFYKLHFRRDLCLSNLNHNRSWPEAFILAAGLNFNFPNQPSIVVPDTLATLIGDPVDGPLEWRTTPVTIKGEDCTLRLKFERWDFDQQANIARWSVWNATSEKAHLDLTNEVQGRCDVFNLGTSFPRQLVNDDPVWWGSAVITGAGFQRAARWED